MIGYWFLWRIWTYRRQWQWKNIVLIKLHLLWANHSIWWMCHNNLPHGLRHSATQDLRAHRCQTHKNLLSWVKTPLVTTDTPAHSGSVLPGICNATRTGEHSMSHTTFFSVFFWSSGVSSFVLQPATISPLSMASLCLESSTPHWYFPQLYHSSLFCPLFTTGAYLSTSAPGHCTHRHLTGKRVRPKAPLPLPSCHLSIVTGQSGHQLVYDYIQSMAMNNLPHIHPYGTHRFSTSIADSGISVTQLSLDLDFQLLSQHRLGN